MIVLAFLKDKTLVEAMEEVLTLLQCIGFALCILLVEPHSQNLFAVLGFTFSITLALPFVLSWFVSPSWPNLILLLFTLLFQANTNISCCLISLTQEQILFVFILGGLFSVCVYYRWIVFYLRLS